MRPYKSLTIANEILNGLIGSGKFTNYVYHSFYSGGMAADGFCGYIIYGEYKKNTIKITFYSVNKTVATPVHVFVSVNGKNTISNRQFNVEDAINFIISKHN